MISNEYYLQEYITTRGLGKKTYKSMKYMLNHYSAFQGLTLHELINEADQEEEQGIRWKRRKLKIRLINYMNYCKDNMKLSSAKAYVKAVKGFYNHHEIEIGKLPSWNLKNANVSEPITAKDLPTKEIIRNAVDLSDPLMKSLILFLCSSGMSKVDCLSLSVNNFIESTYSYHQQDNIPDALNTMFESEMEIIPTFKMRRSKTNKYFITFCSPEATQEIVNYLLLRNKRNKCYHRPLLTGEDKLFKISEGHYDVKFKELNNALNLGKVGTFNRMRGHMLRKFHATMLEKHGMPRYLVKVLQGKSNGVVDDVYFFEDEDTLRDEYIKALEGVLIFTEVKEVTKYSPEYLSIVDENKKLKAQVEKVEQIEKELESIKKWYL